MDGRRPDTLSDEALDRELSAAFAVDHSPEFLTRVRTRIAAEPAPRSPWLRWSMLAACAAPVLLALVVVSPSVWPHRAGTTPAARTADVALVSERIATAAPPTPHLGPAPVPAVRTPAGVAGSRPRRPSIEGPVPEIMISRDEQRAFQLFQQIIRAGALKSDDLVEPEPPPPVPELQALIVAPIRIEPLDHPVSD